MMMPMTVIVIVIVTRIRMIPFPIILKHNLRLQMAFAKHTLRPLQRRTGRASQRRTGATRPRHNNGMLTVQILMNPLPMPTHALAPVFPAAHDLQAHEVLAHQHADEDAVFLVHDFLRGPAFAFYQQRVEAVFASSHVASCYDGVFFGGDEGFVADADPGDAVVGWFARIEFEVDVGDLREAAFEGGVGRDAVFEGCQEGGAGYFDDYAGVFEGETVVLSVES